MKYGLKTKGISAFKKAHGKQGKVRCCNLCNTQFITRTVFDRYCQTCKEQNELFKFSEWLPDLQDEIAEKIPA